MSDIQTLKCIWKNLSWDKCGILYINACKGMQYVLKFNLQIYLI